MNETKLYDLFSNIISKSKTMKRFVVAPGYGNDLNKGNLGEILTDALGGIVDGKKYPLCMMLPPIEIPNYDTNWTKFKCRLFFLKGQSTGTSTPSIKPVNNLTDVKIKEVWKEMRGCAVDFRRVLMQVTENNPEYGIRDGQSIDVIERYSDVGNDKTAGIGISFDIEIQLNCEITDYTQDDINLIIPVE